MENIFSKMNICGKWTASSKLKKTEKDAVSVTNENDFGHRIKMHPYE